MKTKIKPGGELTDFWYCPECDKWVKPWAQGCSKGMLYANCPHCGLGLEHNPES